MGVRCLRPPRRVGGGVGWIGVRRTVDGAARCVRVEMEVPAMDGVLGGAVVRLREVTCWDGMGCELGWLVWWYGL